MRAIRHSSESTPSRRRAPRYDVNRSLYSSFRGFGGFDERQSVFQTPFLLWNPFGRGCPGGRLRQHPLVAGRGFQIGSREIERGRHRDRHPGRTGSRPPIRERDRKSTRLNSSHRLISHAVFFLKKNQAVLYDGKEVSEGLLAVMVTVLIGVH